MPIEFLSKLTNNNIEKIALECMWNAKASQMICAKGVKFRQYSYSKPTPPNFYCNLWLGSGSGKNLAVDLINDYLMPFLKPAMDIKIDEWKKKYQSKNAQPTGDKKADRETNKIVNDYLAKIEEFHIDIASATFSGVYKVASQINETGCGAINILITEFGDFIDSVTSGDMNKKELFESLKDMSDGKVMPRIIAGETRKSLSNIPITAILASDFENLFDAKNNKYYIKMLKTGMARRSFIYITKEQKKNKAISVAEREKAQMRGLELGRHFEQIYNSIPENAVYDFSDRAKERLEEWHNECIDNYNNEKFSDSILAAEEESSFWKITKLAVIYSIIDEPQNMLIDIKYIEKAINFYKSIQPCLEMLLEKKAPSEVDKLNTFMLQWAKKAKKPIKSEEIRKGIDYKSTPWKSFRDEYLPTTLDWLEAEHGIIIRPYSGFGGNTKAWQVVK